MPRKKKIDIGTQKVCGEKCKECVYHITWENIDTDCGYMYYTGNRRPCDAGDDCVMFMPILGNEKYRR